MIVAVFGNPSPVHAGGGLPVIDWAAFVTVVLAVATTEDEVGLGFVTLNPVGKVHVASVFWLHISPGGRVAATVRFALAERPISIPLMRREPVVLI